MITTISRETGRFTNTQFVEFITTAIEKVDGGKNNA